MASIQKINENIFRTTMPYKDIFTTVYTLNTHNGAVLFDAGSFDSDVEEYILPLLKEAGISAEQLKYVFISHNHKDHSGGLAALTEAFPQVRIVTGSATLREKYGNGKVICPAEGEMLLDSFRFIPIPGHTIDSGALLDIRTDTLITGDCLQQQGICGSGDWASNIPYPAEHRQAVEKLRTLGAKQILTAHDYVPHGYRADTEAEAAQMLDACRTPLEHLAALIKQNPTWEDAQIREAFSDSEKQLTINVHVVAAMRKAIETGTWK